MISPGQKLPYYRCKFSNPNPFSLLANWNPISNLTLTLVQVPRGGLLVLRCVMTGIHMIPCSKIPKVSAPSIGKAMRRLGTWIGTRQMYVVRYMTPEEGNAHRNSYDSLCKTIFRYQQLNPRPRQKRSENPKKAGVG